MGWIRGLLGFFGKSAGTVAVVGGTAAVADLALNQGHTIEGLATDGMGAMQRAGADAGVEGSFRGFYKMIEMLADLLQSIGMDTQGMKHWALERQGRTDEAAAIENAAPPTDPSRADQRHYSKGGLFGDVDTGRYTIDGPNGSPASVEFAELQGGLGIMDTLNSGSLFLKGVKDGAGVLAGGVAGGIAGAADFIGLDNVFNFVTGNGWKESENEWGRDVYHNVAGAVNETTDAIFYDSIRLATFGTVDWEPTIRSESDMWIYRGGNAVGATIMTGGLTTYGVGMYTGGMALTEAFTVASIGDGLATAGGFLWSQAGNILGGLFGMGGPKPTP